MKFSNKKKEKASDVELGDKDESKELLEGEENEKKEEEKGEEDEVKQPSKKKGMLDSLKSVASHMPQIFKKSSNSSKDVDLESGTTNQNNKEEAQELLDKKDDKKSLDGELEEIKINDDGEKIDPLAEIDNGEEKKRSTRKERNTSKTGGKSNSRIKSSKKSLRGKLSTLSGIRT